MNKVLFLASLILKGLDVVTTAYLIHRSGVCAEGNPFVRDMFSAYGIVPSFIIAFAIFGALVTILYKYKQRALLMLSVVFMVVVIINNTLAIFMWW